MNPYIVDDTAGAEIFFGREDAFEFIQRNLTEGHSDGPIVLHGQRRTGKTSVLVRLNRHLGPGYRCVFIDLRQLNLNGMGNLLQGISAAISRALSLDHQIAVEVPDQAAFISAAASTFEALFLGRVWAAIGDSQLVLMLDEAIRLDEEVRAGRLERGVFDYLRHLMQYHQRLNFVFSLSRSIEEMSRDCARLFSAAPYHRISLLERAPARELIIRLAHGHYELTDNAVDRIFQLTSGHPNYTQLLCQCISDSRAGSSAASVGVEDIDAALPNAVELGSAEWTYAWENFTAAEQALMAGIAAAARGNGAQVTAAQARQEWRGIDVDLPRREVRRAVRGLTSREVISGNSEFSFTVDLQRLWTEKNRSVAGVAADLAQLNPSAPSSPPAMVKRIGRTAGNDVVIRDLVISRYHAELRKSQSGRYTIVDTGSYNGTYVNGIRVNQAELTDGDILSFGHTAFRLADGKLIEYVDDGRATFEAHELRVVVHDGGKHKVLLDGITFALAERSMTAVIGPAGAGKSTLLNALTGKRPASAGSVFYDDRDLYDNYDELRHRIGLVPEESVTHKQLTPQTALGYAAELRFPPDTTKAERDQRVGEVLDELSMSWHARTRIDRLSASQKKRLSIGMELLTKPSLLFLDEPTSPLDPHLKRDMFAQMRKMADPSSEAGQSVIVSTNDVDSKLLDQCDRLIVLQPGGKMAYFGPAAEGLRYFGKEDWADVFQAFADEPERDFAAEYPWSPDHVKYVANPMAVRGHLAPERSREEAVPLAPRRPGRLKRLSTLSRRDLRVRSADRGHWMFTVLLTLILGGLVRAVSASGLAWPLNGSAQQTLLILAMAVALCGLVDSIGVIIGERDIFAKERMAGLPADVYAGSKVLVLSAVSVVQTVTIVLIGLLGRQMPPQGSVVGPAYIEILVGAAVLGLVSMLVGLMVSALVTRAEQTMPALVVIVLLQVMLTGALFPLTGVAAWLEAIDPAHWGLSALASTANLNYAMAPGEHHDALWAHTPAQWFTDMGWLIGIGLICLLLTLWRLSGTGPRRRKKSR